MLSSMLLALLLPACSGGSVVLDDGTATPDGNEEEEEVVEEEEEEEEEEVEPLAFDAEVVGFNERFGDYCEGEVELTLDDGVLTGSGSCEDDWSSTEIWIEGEVDGDDVDGEGGVFLDFGWGEPIEEEGRLRGEANADGIDISFEIEVNFGGGGGGGDQVFEFTIEGDAD